LWKAVVSKGGAGRRCGKVRKTIDCRRSVHLWESEAKVPLPPKGGKGRRGKVKRTACPEKGVGTQGG